MQKLLAEVAEYDSLKAELEEKRSVFLKGEASHFSSAGNTLFWVEGEVGDPILHSYDSGSKQTTNYGFKVHLSGPSSPSPFAGLNYSASTTMIATMNELDGANTYAVGSENSPLGKLKLPAPPYGQKWWAYRVDGDNLYVMLQEEADGKFHLKRWSPGDAALTEVLVLDDLIAPNVMGPFYDFAVSGSTLIWDEGSRIWIAELTDTKAKWAKNERQVDSADFEKGSVVYSEAHELWRYDVASDSRENLTEKIRESYEMNTTFAEAHYPRQHSTWVKREGVLFYEANSGIFAYDIDENKTQPMLLDGRDNSVIYKYPSALVNGTIFVKGLESTHGSVGADGPTFMFVP
jgi:hypothetical protein